MENKIKPIMRVFCKRDWWNVRSKYRFTVSSEGKKVVNAKDTDVLVLQTQFRNGFHMIDNVWILNEESPDTFMELMFGEKREEFRGNTWD